MLLCCFIKAPFDIILVLILFIGGFLGSKMGVILNYFIPQYLLSILGCFVVYYTIIKFAFSLFEIPLGFFDFKTVNLSISSKNLTNNFLEPIASFAQHHKKLYVFFGLLMIIILSIVLDKVVQKVSLILYKDR